MARTAWLVGLVATYSLLMQGCTHFNESRTVEQFAEALENKDAKAVHAATTPEFRQLALRHAKALDDLEILNLADGEVNVVKVEEKSDDEKRIFVEMGKRKKKLVYHVVQDKRSGKWLIDEISVTQRKRGATVQKPVTEQMDLLLTVREFLDAWEGGSRSAILNVSSTELATVLQELPKEDLHQLTVQIVGKKSKNHTHRPKAELNGEAAVVSLSRLSGKMILAFNQFNGKWKVSDVAVESREDKNHLPSLLKKAVVMQTADRFLQSYAAADSKQLSKLCTSKFFGDSLQHVNRSDIAAMPLRPTKTSSVDTEVQLEGSRANYLLRSNDRIVRVTLLKSDTRNDAGSPTEYLVEDVAIYDLRSKQEVRLASYFTARAIAQVFADGLAKRNLNLLQKTASSDFRDRVFSRIDSGLLRGMPMLGLNRPGFRIDNIVYHGSVTELQVRQGKVDAIYILREQQGRVRVDDVLVLKYGKQHSLKEASELAVPIHLFAKGIARGDVPLLQRHSSGYLNRLIWRQTSVVPPSALAAPKYLVGDITSVEKLGDERIVTFGTQDFGAKVRLVTEHGKFVVDDVRVIAGRRPEQQANLKQAMRMELATNGVLLPSARPDQQESPRRGGILAPNTPDRGRSVTPAGYERSTSTPLPYGLDNSNSPRSERHSTLRPDLNGGSAVRTADLKSYAPDRVDPNGIAFADFKTSVPGNNSPFKGSDSRSTVYGRNPTPRAKHPLEDAANDFDREFEAEMARRRAAMKSEPRTESPMSTGTHPMMRQHPLR